jgi:dienelactone hydrolase
MFNIPDDFIGMPNGYPPDLTYAEIKKRFKKLLGETETTSCPLNLQITEEVELAGKIIRQRIEYDVGNGEIVPAYYLFSKDIADDAPGILSIHGHGDDEIFPVGKAFHCHPDANDPVQYSYIAALNGFRVLAPDALCFGERQTKWGYSTHFFDEIVAHAELTSRGKSLAWKSVWDNSRAIEVLEQLGSKNIGVIGWSGGSTQAYILASINEKVKAAVCFFSFMTLRHQFYQYHCCHCLYHYIPGMMRAGIDWDQVAALTAPRKLFLTWGALDEGTPEPMYRAFVDTIEKRCQTENLPQSVFTYEEKDKGHEITKKMLETAIKKIKEEIK